MKSIVTIILLFIGLALIAVKTNNINSRGIKISINKEEVDSILIANYCSPMDSCRFVRYKLDDMITELLIGKLNDARGADPDGFFQEYTLYIYTSDGIEKEFAMNGSLIIDNSSKNCFRIQDENYFENLWEEQDKKNVGM